MTLTTPVAPRRRLDATDLARVAVFAALGAGHLVSAFVGPSAGYLFGWIAGAFVIGLIVHAGRRAPVWWRTLLGMIVGGILVVYLFGVPVQSLVTRLPLDATALMSLVFVPGDLVKAVIATAVVTTLVRAYPRAFRRTWVSDQRAVTADPAAPAESRVP